MTTALEKQKPAEVSTETGADPWLSMIERAARDPSVDVSKMERMFDMRERLMRADAQQAFNAAFVAVRAEVGPIVRNKANTQTHSRYADLFAVADVLDPIMTKHGFAATFGTGDCPKDGFYRVTGTLMHSAGHSKEYFADVPADDAGLKGNANKTATHAFGSTFTYGRRYLKVAMFDLAITDKDGNAPKPPPEQKSAYRARKDGDWEKVSERLCERMAEFSTREDMTAWWDEVRNKDEEYMALPKSWRQMFYETEYQPRLEALVQ